MSFSYKEDRRLIELVRERDRTSHGPTTEHDPQMGSPIGHFPEKEQPKVEPDQTPNTITRSSMSAPGGKADIPPQGRDFRF
jgi:hypothetical protein